MNRRGFLTLLAGLAAAVVVTQPDEASANGSAPAASPPTSDAKDLAAKVEDTSSDFSQYRRRRYGRRRVYGRGYGRRRVYRRRAYARPVYRRRVYRRPVYRRAYARRRVYRPMRVRWF
ncbi:MAG: twin-arginine translocation signal domain-containing protein [Bosea sp. (in: a-proteobacteria)]